MQGVDGWTDSPAAPLLTQSVQSIQMHRDRLGTTATAGPRITPPALLLPWSELRPASFSGVAHTARCLERVTVSVSKSASHMGQLRLFIGWLCIHVGNIAFGLDLFGRPHSGLLVTTAA